MKTSRTQTKWNTCTPPETPLHPMFNGVHCRNMWQVTAMQIIFKRSKNVKCWKSVQIIIIKKQLGWIMNKLCGVRPAHSIIHNCSSPILFVHPTSCRQVNGPGAWDYTSVMWLVKNYIVSLANTITRNSSLYTNTPSSFSRQSQNSLPPNVSPWTPWKKGACHLSCQGIIKAYDAHKVLRMTVYSS